jgi:hypothetical protein
MLISKHPLTDSPVTRLQVGIGIGIPACTLCIFRRLYKVLVRQTGAVTQDEKRRIVITDLLITAGLPILAMGLRKFAQRSSRLAFVYIDVMQSIL